MNSISRRKVLDCGDGVCGVAALAAFGRIEPKFPSLAEAKSVTSIHFVTTLQVVGARVRAPYG